MLSALRSTSNSILHSIYLEWRGLLFRYTEGWCIMADGSGKDRDMCVLTTPLLYWVAGVDVAVPHSHSSTPYIHGQWHVFLSEKATMLAFQLLTKHAGEYCDCVRFWCNWVCIAGLFEYIFVKVLFTIKLTFGKAVWSMTLTCVSCVWKSFAIK